MLNVSLTALDRGEVVVREQIPMDDPMWEGSGVTLAAPLDVDLTARPVGDGVFVRGRLRTTVRQACRRCLCGRRRPRCWVGCRAGWLTRLPSTRGW